MQIWLRALRLGGYPELFGWTKYSLIGSKKCNKNADAEVSHTVWKGFPSPLLALKMEEGGHEPKNADSRTGKRQGNTIFLYPLQPPEWNTVPKPFTFAQWVYIRLVTYKTVINKFMLFKATRYMVICYSGNKKLISMSKIVRLWMEQEKKEYNKLTKDGLCLNRCLVNLKFSKKNYIN